MKRKSVVSFWTLAVGVVSFAALLSTPAAGQELSDPYEIFGKYFDASGGLARMSAERTQHLEGALSVGGMQGTIKIWVEKPGKSRVEAETGPLRITEGDNGQISWVLDTNGKVQKTSKADEVALERKEVDSRMAQMEYAVPNSDIFSAALQGTDTVDGAVCYVLNVTNSINTDRYVYYISADGFRLLKMTALRGEESADTYYGDYREVDGLLVAFYTKQIEHQTGQPQELVVTEYKSNPDLDPALFDPPEQVAKDYEFTAGQAAENIPFKFIDNHLYIPVLLNGAERLWVIDTGASVSVVDAAVAEAIGLKPEGDIKGVGAGGTVDVGFVTLPDFEVTGIRFGPQTVAAVDLSSIVRRLGIDIAGILGFDFLSRFVTKIDYANGTVSFYDPEAFEYEGPGHPVDVHVKEGVFEVPAVLDGAHAGTWMFDVGSSMVTLDGRYALREGYAERPGVVRMGGGAGGEFQIKTVRADSIQLAGFTVYNPRLDFGYGATDTVFNGDRLGEIGNTLLRHFVVYVDYSRERVILEKGDKFLTVWPEDKSGLSLGWTADRGGVEVIYVSPGTPAEDAGFEKGDVIKSVDGTAVEPRSGILAVRDLLKGPSGTVYNIVAERAGRAANFALTLTDLY